MKSEEEGFILAMLASPRDTSLRLVYADWLEERDDPRGEFLRLGCLLPEYARHPDYWAMRTRRQELMLGIDLRWLILIDEPLNELLVSGVILQVSESVVRVDLGIFRGYIHFTDYWQGRGSPTLRQRFKVGQRVEARVVRVNLQRGSIDLIPNRDPCSLWVGILERYPLGKQFRGEVVDIFSYGVFVSLQVGVEGLVHRSRLRLRKGQSLVDSFARGDQLEVRILDIDQHLQRISLELVENVG